MLFVFVATSSKEDSITHAAQKAYEHGKPLDIFSVLPIAYATYNERSASNLFLTLVKHRTAVVPTLYVMKTGVAELKESDLKLPFQTA
jgi:hypothetical protein